MLATTFGPRLRVGADCELKLAIWLMRRDPDLPGRGGHDDHVVLRQEHLRLVGRQRHGLGHGRGRRVDELQLAVGVVDEHDGRAVLQHIEVGCRSSKRRC